MGKGERQAVYRRQEATARAAASHGVGGWRRQSWEDYHRLPKSISPQSFLSSSTLTLQIPELSISVLERQWRGVGRGGGGRGA